MEKSRNLPVAKSVATINGKKIIVIKNGEERIAIKPICEALGVDYSSQLKKIKADVILSSTMVLSTTVGADKKQREMATIPFKFVFGWLFKIDARNIKEQARNNLLKYQLECYNVLYDYFTSYQEFVEERQKLMNEKMDELHQVKQEFATAKNKLKETEKELYEIGHLDYWEYKAQQNQMKMAFGEEGGEE